MHVMAPEGVSTCRSRSAKREWVEKVYYYVTACSSLKGRISDMQVIEDFESRPRKAVTFVVGKGKERQEWNEQKLPKASPGYSGGRLPGRNTEEKGREEREEEKEQRRGKMRKSKKELEALRRWPWKGKTPYKGVIARRLRMKKKKKVGKKATIWQDNGKSGWINEGTDQMSDASNVGVLRWEWRTKGSGGVEQSLVAPVGIRGSGDINIRGGVEERSSRCRAWYVADVVGDRADSDLD